MELLSEQQYKAYDFQADANWKAYSESLNKVSLGSLFELVKRQWYQKHVDLKLNPMSNGEPLQDKDLLSFFSQYFSKVIPDKENLIPTSIIMLRPMDFSFNEQTAGDNEFQKKLAEESSIITQRAINEFDQFVEKLRAKGIDVIVFDKSNYKQLQSDKTPDSVFPNNWLSTDPSGFVFTYPMLAPNRRAEKNAYPFIESILLEQGYNIKGVLQIGSVGENEKFLEGTGSMIIDRQNKQIYAAKSQRTNEQAFNEFCKLVGYEAIAYDTQSSNGKAYYHTNVIQCVGDTFIIICKECIAVEDQQKVFEKLNLSGKEIIDITREQVEKQFCGNALQLKNKEGQKFIVMSEKAFKGFTEDQKKILEKHGEIIYSNLDTIEDIGGGSARCMMCENYLSKQTKK